MQLTFPLRSLLDIDSQLLVAYWDRGSCGAFGNDNNYAWCNKESGEGCYETVQTNDCPQGIATLQEFYGDPYSSEHNDAFEWAGCKYQYYAIYACQGTRCLFESSHYEHSLRLLKVNL